MTTWKKRQNDVRVHLVLSRDNFSQHATNFHNVSKYCVTIRNDCPCKRVLNLIAGMTLQCNLRPNSWTKSRKKSIQSPQQLCLEVSIFSNSRNLLQILQFSYCTLLWRKEENLIENHNIFSLVKEIHTETSILWTFNIMPRNLNEIVSSWIRLWSLHEYNSVFAVWFPRTTSCVNRWEKV